MIMGTDMGGYLVSALVVRPWKSCRKPQSSALLSVKSTGENNLAWVKATRSAGVVVATAARL